MALPRVTALPTQVGLIDVIDATTKVGNWLTTNEPVLPAVLPIHPFADAVNVYIPASCDAAANTPAVGEVGVVISPVCGPVQTSV
jgi:hypothetical protein